MGLRAPDFAQLETVVDRALAIAQAEPGGPVYLALPREVLGRAHEVEYAEPSRARRPAALVPDPATIDGGAHMLARRPQPVIIVKAVGRDPGAVPALVRTGGGGRRAGLRLVPHLHELPPDHPLHAGFDPGRTWRRRTPSS